MKAGLDAVCLLCAGGIAGDSECFKQFNPKGSVSGHCGTDADKNYIKCDNE